MEEYEYHINLTKKDGAKYVIMPGDPGRTEEIAAYIDDAKELAFNREFRTFRGYIEGEPVLAVSSGIGGPSAAICMEELVHIGADTFIRIGTCGGMQMDVDPGDLIIATGAIRMDGTSKEYMPIEFPAVANLDVTNAIVESAKKLGYKYHVGIVQAKDSFYGQQNPDSMGVDYELKNKWNAWIRGGCLASEMESATMFVISSLRNLRAGAVFHCVWNQEQAKKSMPQERELDTNSAIETAVEAVRLLIKSDKAKQ